MTQKIPAILIVPEYFSALDSPGHEMMLITGASSRANLGMHFLYQIHTGS